MKEVPLAPGLARRRSIGAARRWLLPLALFGAVFLLHFAWVGFFPETNPEQSRWVTVPTEAQEPWVARYVDAQDYWLGLSYGVTLAFAAVAFRRYREQRTRRDRNLALGGLTLSGGLSLVGCFLLGCCGSPMLAVYLNMFGASFLPLAKPLTAGLTLASVLAAWWWMNRAPERCDCDSRCSGP